MATTRSNKSTWWAMAAFGFMVIGFHPFIHASLFIILRGFSKRSINSCLTLYWYREKLIVRPLNRQRLFDRIDPRNTVVHTFVKARDSSIGMEWNGVSEPKSIASWCCFPRAAAVPSSLLPSMPFNRKTKWSELHVRFTTSIFVHIIIFLHFLFRWTCTKTKRIASTVRGTTYIVRLKGVYVWCLK